MPELRGGDTLLLDELVRVSSCSTSFSELSCDLVFRELSHIDCGDKGIDIEAGAAEALRRRVHCRERKGHELVEVPSMGFTVRRKAPRTVIGLLIGSLEQGLALLGNHKRQRAVRTLGQNRRRGVLDTRLLNAHVDDIGGVARKSQVAERLADEEHENEQSCNDVVLQIPKNAHRPQRSRYSASRPMMRMRVRTSSSPR